MFRKPARPLAHRRWGGSLTQVYSLYAGPTLATQKGDVAMTAHYHAGYTSLNSQGNVTANGATAGVDRLDHSTVQEGRLAIGNRPGEGLPSGWARTRASIRKTSRT
jgi:hypothetical protein